MNTQVSFRQMDSSPALRDYATGKLERIVDKYVTGPTDATVVMKVQKYWHIADFTLNIKNLTIKGQERSEDMYSSIDLALDKIEKQLRRHKDRLRDHKPAHGDSKPFRMGVVRSLDSFEDSTAEEFEDYLVAVPEAASEEAIADESPAAVAPSAEKSEVKVKLLRKKDLAAKALTLEEAIIQLDLMEQREFYVFTNVETRAINVVYKRRDGHIGLIET